MKTLAAAAATAVVAAATAVALAAPTPPFPPPKFIGVTPEMKCDWGPITEIKSDSRLVVRTDAGPFTVETGSKVRVAGPDGKALPSVSSLRLGQNVRVYYLVNDGARAQEIDVTQ